VTQDNISHSFKRMIDLIIPYKTENFEQVLGHQFFERQAAAWCQDIKCKQLFHECLQVWRERGL
jgi:hypothetical protein